MRARIGLLVLCCAACATAGSAPREDGEPRSAEAYGVAASPDAVRGRDSDDLAGEITALLRDLAMPVAGDGRLAELARGLAARARAEERQARAAQLGLVDGQLHVVELERRAGEPWGDAVQRTLKQVLVEMRPTHYGAYVFDGSYAHVVFGRRPPAFDPVPRRLPAGEPLVLRGRLPGDAGRPVVELVTPDGAYRALSAGAGPGFEVRVPTAQEGAHRVTIRGTDGGTLARLQVQVGREHVGAAGVAGEGALPAATIYYDEIARLRRAMGLRPMAAASQLERAAATGVRPAGGLVLQAVVRAADGAGLRGALARVPAARAAIIHADVTHVGVHLARAAGGGLELRLITARVQHPGASELSAARLLEATNRARRARGAEPLAPEPRFGRVARTIAAAHLRGELTSEQAMVDAANVELERFSLGYRRVAALVAFVSDPGEVSALEPALDPEASVVGFGVARRDHERGQLEHRGVAVVVALGWPR
ncbi:MAG: hypothetical protein OXT09_03335 [Myxococcales bacterium]|nr:hypothetical protein [Myxococcales bacterium]